MIRNYKTASPVEVSWSSYQKFDTEMEIFITRAQNDELAGGNEIGSGRKDITLL